MAFFENTKSYAQAIQIAPFALVDDGLLDICIVKKIGKLKIMKTFLKVFIKTPLFRLPEVRIYKEILGVKVYQAKKIYLQSYISLPFHGDAEIISATPLSLEVIPKALRVIVPINYDPSSVNYKNYFMGREVFNFRKDQTQSYIPR